MNKSHFNSKKVGKSNGEFDQNLNEHLYRKGPYVKYAEYWGTVPIWFEVTVKNQQICIFPVWAFFHMIWFFLPSNGFDWFSKGLQEKKRAKKHTLNFKHLNTSDSGLKFDFQSICCLELYAQSLENKVLFHKYWNFQKNLLFVQLHDWYGEFFKKIIDTLSSSKNSFFLTKLNLIICWSCENKTKLTFSVRKHFQQCYKNWQKEQPYNDQNVTQKFFSHYYSP